MVLESHKEKLFQVQRQSLDGEKATQLHNRTAFNRQQAKIFDNHADWYISDEAVPPDLLPRLKKIVQAAFPDLSPEAYPESPHFLDAGCGAGVLFDFMLSLYPGCRITGVDLSSAQIHNARARFPQKPIKFWQGDIADYNPGTERFDAAWCNACFGNFYNQNRVVRHIASLLKPGGRLLVTHPLGYEFVKTLHENGPEQVPHLLPASKDEAINVAEGSGLRFESLLMKQELYILVFRKA
ncbi:class I SAM-dependent methyltransferase [Sansalvadorimonas sp. 2012CJ34-2]|uniref:Class I SAM-dependent methyltransferase n=1 Tax=Parendozoicomonas callyspongiae TaxID=2942213 RepID=A0ABT0PDM3_9GAMM|nr:class I SAM-dependent methyltransferase [Sansalvadorimonas sp. 2012CJ34-2]MCL6269460.1 class I SAM-dependent methyltransferase [Sansalvadorimonas sp. 2012CJ34-2]